MKVRCMAKELSGFRMKELYIGWGDGRLGMGDIEGDMVRGESACEIGRVLVLAV